MTTVEGATIRGRLVRPLAVVAAAAAAALAFPAAAGAAPATPTSVVHSTSFAGYTASIGGSAETFSGRVTVPTVTCPASGDETIAAGASIETSSTIINFDNDNDCVNGS